MKKSELRSYVENTHSTYLEIANREIAEADALSDGEFTLKGFHLAKATEYVNKADALLEVLEFIRTNK